MPFIVDIILRLIFAGLLGGVIGYEREYTDRNRPAGFRTHILVCVGSALVMVTSEYLFIKYDGSIDPARLGAQVVSGIGFLGAGTIIRDGVSVRGLTTAASLWAVSCVGIAVGAGFYGGAAVATMIVFLTLIILKKAEIRFTSKKRHRAFAVEADDVPGLVGAVTNLLEQNKIKISDIQIHRSKGNSLVIKLKTRLPGNMLDMQVVSDIRKIDGIRKVYEE
ncbi:MAG: MgtC/SapB family protein [Acetivibrionales bacterium]|jgi:putative Mg2+ transporter-C (MgtC) family protein